MVLVHLNIAQLGLQAVPAAGLVPAVDLAEVEPAGPDEHGGGEKKSSEFHLGSEDGQIVRRLINDSCGKYMIEVLVDQRRKGVPLEYDSVD